MGIHEECGVFGIINTRKKNVAEIVYYGLYALQHRGQESCGIVVNDEGVFTSHKDLGLVSEVFTKDSLSHLPEGTMAVGHVRYGTTGGTTRNNCQPIEVNHQKGKMAVAHNGNLSNALELRDKLELSGAIFHTTSDTETIAYVITRERLMTPSIEDAVSNTMNLLEGAYSLVLVSSAKMIAARDPYGFRPLCYGQMSDGSYVHASRIRAGQLLAENYPAKADVVIGVPDSGLDAALGYANKSGIPYGIGLIKNKYIGRTFISPSQNERLDKVRIKLSPVKNVIDGKRVVLIDDSIVRGTTSRQIVKLLRDAGAREIHMRISAPPFLHPCYYGTDIDSEENLIACHHSTEEIAGMLGVNSLGYLEISQLGKLIESEDYCAACFNGRYPTRIPIDLRKDRFERKLSEREK